MRRALAVFSVLGLAIVTQAAAPGAAGPGQVFKDCADCPEMVVIPAGNFLMGSPNGGPQRPVSEEPRHAVTIGKPFALGRFEITRVQYGRFVADTHYDATKGGCAGLLAGKDYTDNPAQNWSSPGWQQAETHPVICMGWNDAKAYVDWLARKTGKKYRLPSEAEWEYAARAGSTSEYWWGDDVNAGCANENGADLDAKAVFADWQVANCHDGFAISAPVGSFKANPFGLFDVAGNAWELLADCFHPSYDGAPSDGSAWTQEVKPGDCHNHMRRGGSWDHFTWITRSATRLSDEVDVHFRKGNIGFRVARDM